VPRSSVPLHERPKPLLRGWLHTAAFGLSIPAGLVLVIVAPSTAARVAAVVYWISLLAQFGASAMYHRVDWSAQAHARMRTLDHSMIFVLIAGTYTPFTLVTLRGALGWTLFGVVWGLAIAGIAQEFWLARGARWGSLVIYLLMGWLGMIAVMPLVHSLGPAGFAWLAAGGILYTGGILFYLYDEKWRHAHGIWHLFVLGGSAAHFVTVLVFVA